jgi:hypothetical protein
MHGHQPEGLELLGMEGSYKLGMARATQQAPPVIQKGRSMMRNSVFSKGSALSIVRPLCLVFGFLSIAASIVIWNIAKEPDPAHGERFGIFVGLWAPTFFILASQFRRATPDRSG